MSCRVMRLLICCLLGLWGLGAAQAMTVAQSGNRLLVDGVPTTLTFARGCTDPAWVPAYRALGFNTLLIRVDSPGARAMTQARALINAADQAELYILIELAHGSWSANQIESLTDDAYRANATDFLDEVVPALRDTPRLLGWIIATVDESRLVAQLGDFSAFLRMKYGTIDNLNQAWSGERSDGAILRARVPSFDLLTPTNAAGLAGGSSPVILQHVQEDVALYKARVAARDAEWKVYAEPRFTGLDDYNKTFQTKYKEPAAITYQVAVEGAKARTHAGRGVLEIATYQAQATRALFSWWGAGIRERDSEHLLFAGAQHQYRTMISLPPSINGVYTECYPGMAEPDPDSQNPHAYDIARRGNRFIVLAGVTAYHVTPRQFATALYEAALHGAAGVGIADWSGLFAAPGMAETANIALADFRARSLLGQTPAPTVAFVYAPYGVGLYGADRRPLYGYATALFHPGAGQCYFALRHGMATGQIDYLAGEDLFAVPLDRYQTIVLASAYDVPVTGQAALAHFVQGGGTLLMDMGAGTLQATADLTVLPHILRDLANVLNVPGVTQTNLNLEVAGNNTRFPTLPGRGRATGNANGFLISWATQATPRPGTRLLFSAIASRDRTARGVPAKPQNRVLERKPTRGIFSAEQGQGHVLYAPFPLYQNWTRVHPLFTEFHQDLFGAGAMIQLERPAEFLPAFTEIARYADGSVRVWAKEDAAAIVALRNPERRCYAVDDGHCVIGPEGTSLRFTAPGFKRVMPLPISLDPAPFAVNVAVLQANAQGLVLEIGSDDANATQPLTLRFADGEYAIAADSTHRVTIITQDAGNTAVIAADPQGQLILPLPQARCRVLITSDAPLFDVVTPTSRISTVP